MSTGSWRGQTIQLTALLVFQQWKPVLMTSSFHDELSKKTFALLSEQPTEVLLVLLSQQQLALGTKAMGTDCPQGYISSVGVLQQMQSMPCKGA